jgi:opacity protein-like surface antigen/outer membrane protein OmpA-like peptidoglycan-associated protein
MRKKIKHKLFVFAAALLATAGTAVAQEYPTVEMAPGFSYQHNSPVLGGSQSFNCAGGGSTMAYNITSMFGLAADLSGCKIFGLDNTYGVGSKVSGSEFTYVFGPRLTFRNLGKFQPFLEVNFGGERVGISCNTGDAGNACGSIPPGSVPTQLPSGPGVILIPRNPNATSASKNAFALTAGGGFDIKINKKFAIRLVQAEYLYTRFGNDCQFAICSNNNGQNSFRLKSGIVIGWGGARAAILPPSPPRMKPCPGGPSVPVDQDCPRQDISLSIQANPSAICQGAVSRVSASASLPEGATVQWTVNGQAISQAGTLEFGSTGREAGSYRIAMTVSAAGYNDASAETTVTVQGYVPPSGRVSASPAEIWVGDKSTLAANFTPGQCGGAIGPISYSTAEGLVSGNEFDSSGVRFDPANTSEQQKTITIMAKVSDQRGSGQAQTAIVVKQKGAIAAKRFPDIVFPKGSARVNNCGKRVLLEELKSSLDADPNGNVVFVGHTSESEKGSADLDLRRALNAAAVISAGAQVCLGFSAANIGITAAGTADNGVDFQPYFCELSTGEIKGNLVQEADSEAKNRRVEVWFVPSGGVAPVSARGSKSAVELNVKTLGCPK